MISNEEIVKINKEISDVLTNIKYLENENLDFCNKESKQEILKRILSLKKQLLKLYIKEHTLMEKEFFDLIINKN